MGSGCLCYVGNIRNRFATHLSQNLAIPATWMLSMRTFSAGVILLVISVFLYGKRFLTYLRHEQQLFQLLVMLF